MMIECELIELIMGREVFRRYSNCIVEIFEYGIKIINGKNQVFIAYNNILGYEKIKNDNVIVNLEVYCINTF